MTLEQLIASTVHTANHSMSMNKWNVYSITKVNIHIMQHTI